ncbi:hypothetical protein BFJ63_vAg1046 [Fusarium oxysporum f. sp. narcissi]|uniref:Uncharacterized protein n=2 Tax=Fusarium oxysporum TaxID=5507 RepID=A0A4Q2W891_FUSOX|nr:hypothetical protein BFJ65_g12326 [Fusarium oxysporum f. sp. cepae]RYC96172.1 hypothetical protein BFJ63_vAg1046 [Fusarium oxysporum f. sp. narcissi]
MLQYHTLNYTQHLSPLGVHNLVDPQPQTTSAVYAVAKTEFPDRDRLSPSALVAHIRDILSAEPLSQKKRPGA